MQSKWTPALTPLYRPPKSNGWTILEMPEIFPDQIRAAWRVRQKKQNPNGHEAVLEMARFAALNGADITKEVAGAIRSQADAEWCEAEPSRCGKRVKIGAASTPRAQTPEEVKVKVTITNSRAPARAPARRAGGCCGGRGAR